jgi:hypothetical protein
MPREARLFMSCSGSPVRGFIKLHGNITPRWIANAHASRKRLEPAINEGLRSLQLLRRNHPAAKVATRNAEKKLRSLLRLWETAYQKESFYRGVRVLLELQREGSSIL